MSAPAPTINGMSGGNGEAAWWAIYSEHTIRAAITKAPDGPVVRLTTAEYIPVQVRRTTGHIIAYTPTHGLYDRVTAGARYIQWVEASRIHRT